MKLSTTLRHVAFVIVALASILFSTNNSFSQTTYNRHVVFEEVTGTWCQYCPAGAWYADSTEHKYGDYFVALAWHGPMAYSEPMAIPAGDSLMANFGLGGYPNALLNRTYSGGFNEPAFGTGNYTQGSRVLSELKKPALVDFRIVNVTYNAGSKDVEFDLDITPLDITTMMKEDTADYATVAVLTEDDLVYDQTHHQQGQLEGFIHHNVVRKVGGKVMGDKITLGTLLSSPSFPVRKHYKMKVDGAWNPDKIKAKAFVIAIHHKNKTPKYNEIFEGAQTGYVGGLAPEVVPAVWIVLPTAGYKIKKAVPTKIVWSKGGTTTNVKLEYTVDGGTTWTTIVASTDKSPYAWTLPEADYGKTAQIRVSDASNSAVKALSAEFPTPGLIAVTKPAAGDTVHAGMATLIQWTKANVSGKYEYHYSTDGGVTWNFIGVLNNPDATAYSGWTVPDIATTQAVVRVTDGNDPSISATSGVFTIYKESAPEPGKFTSLTLAGIINGKIPSSFATEFTWQIENTVGNEKYIDMSDDNKATWTHIGHVVGDVISMNWTTPADHVPAAYFRIYSLADKSDQYVTLEPVEIGSSISVKNLGGTPTAFTMSANYPNPFTATTNINFEVPERSFVTLSVRNELGVEVARLVNENLDAGKYSVDLSAEKLANGLYTYILESGSTKLVGKMTVVK